MATGAGVIEIPYERGARLGYTVRHLKPINLTPQSQQEMMEDFLLVAQGEMPEYAKVRYDYYCLTHETGDKDEIPVHSIFMAMPNGTYLYGEIKEKNDAQVIVDALNDRKESKF